MRLNLFKRKRRVENDRRADHFQPIFYFQPFSRRPLTTTLLVLLLSVSTAFAQLPNQVFYDADSIVSADSGKWSVSLRSMAFTKNNEYFNGIADGFTLFGTQLNPRLTYTVNPIFKIEGGVYVRDDFGNPGIQDIIPTISLQAKYMGMDLVFGAIHGGLNHRLIEPLYDFERMLVDRIENGVQFRLENDHTFADLWVEWETMIYKGDPEQEEMYGGFSYLRKIGNSGFEIPMQILVYHKGGQIDANPNPLQTLGNFAVGAVHKSQVGNLKWENSLYYVYYKEFSRTQAQVYNDGNGYYANSMVTMGKGLQLMVSYWRGNEFIGLQGGQLYPSVSSTFKRSDYLEPLRQLLILRIMHDTPLGKNVFLTTRIEPFYDFTSGKVEFSNALYLQYRANYKKRK